MHANPRAPENASRDRAAKPVRDSAIISTRWQGPLPPPEALEQFDRIVPNGAERIMVMCEKEQSSRLNIERSRAIAEVWIEAGGRIVGAVLVLTCIGAAIWSIYQGTDWKVTLGFLSVPVMGALAKLFERGRD